MSDLVGNPEDRFSCVAAQSSLSIIVSRGRGGVKVDRRTPNREVLGSIPTGGTMLCPLPRVLVNTQEAVTPSRNDFKILLTGTLNLNTNKFNFVKTALQQSCRVQNTWLVEDFAKRFCA